MNRLVFLSLILLMGCGSTSLQPESRIISRLNSGTLTDGDTYQRFYNETNGQYVLCIVYRGDSISCFNEDSTELKRAENEKQ